MIMVNKIQKILKSKVFKNGIWLTILQFVNTIIPVLTVPYITRILGTEEYGNFSIALNWILYFQVLVEFGFGLSGARKVALINDENELEKLFDNIISSRILLFLISFALLNIVSLISGFNLKIYVCMLLLFIMILGTTFQLTWLFQGKQDMKFITITNVISRVVSVVLIFLLVKSKNDLYVYCILYSITLFLSSAISMIVARKKYNLSFHFSKIYDIKNEINDGKYLFASSAIIKIFSGFGITVLGIVSTSSNTGIYSAIYKIPYILTMFFSPISQAIFPYNSAKFKDNFIKGINNVRKICIPIFIIFFMCGFLIIILRNIIVNILFGAKYEPYSIIVIPLVIQFLLAIVNNFLGIQTLIASGNQKGYSECLSIGCVAIVLFNIILGSIFDLYGVALAAALGELILTISLFIKCKKLINKYSNVL